MGIGRPAMWGAAALAGVMVLGGIAAAETTGQTTSGGASSSGPAHHMMPAARRGRMGVAGVAQGTISNNSFAVTSQGKTYSVTVGSSTKYSYGPGLTASAAAVTSGSRVMVRGTVSGTAVTATAVNIQLPGARGQVVSVSGSEVTVQDPSGRQAVIDISGVSNAPSVSQYEDVAAVGSWSNTDTGSVADTLDAQAFAVVPARLGGTLSNVSGAPGATGSATVQTRSGKSVTLNWTATTTFKTFAPHSWNGSKGSSSSSGSSSTTPPAAPTTLSSGQMIIAQGQWSGPEGASGSTFTATQITVLPAGVPGQGGGRFGGWGHGSGKAGPGHPPVSGGAGPVAGGASSTGSGS